MAVALLTGCPTRHNAEWNPATTYLAAAIQITAGPDKAANLERAERLVRVGAARGANLVASPDVFNWRGKRNEQAAAAETLDGQSLTLMSRPRARAGNPPRRRIDHRTGRRRVAMLQHVRAARPGRRPNRRVSQDSPLRRRSSRPRDGARIGFQTRRRAARPAPTPLGTIGLSICYDLRFPELYRRLTFAGAQVIAVPSAFTFPTGEAHWEALLRARAIENQAYVIAPAQFGPNIYGYSDYGNSMIVDPWGRVIARAADQEGVVVAPIDLDYQDRVRRELPALKHTRIRADRD